MMDRVNPLPSGYRASLDQPYKPQDGDIVVFRGHDGIRVEERGLIGVVRIIPGFNNLEFQRGCSVLMVSPGSVRPLTTDDRVVEIDGPTAC